MKQWEQLPPQLKNEAVRPYYDLLKRRGGYLFAKRCFDIFASLILLILLSPVFLVLAVEIRRDSPGPVFYRQERVTTYGKVFRIFKFRTMVNNADRLGALVTAEGDSRITKIGARIRGSHLDEIPQLLNVLAGDMSFVGTRPEVPKYVAAYSDEMTATLLMPAGITSPASICCSDEYTTLRALEEQGIPADEAYLEHVLPEKMKYNLSYLKECGFVKDISVCIKTVF